jgi:L-fucose isomerase-like protein
VTNFAYLVVASDLHDAATVDRVTAGVRATLDGLGGSVVSTPGEHTSSPLIILVATGGTEAAILDHIRRRRSVVPFEPILLAAHPLHNSLPAAMEALARVRADGGLGRIVQVRPGARGSVATAVADVAAIHRLHRTRLGLVGEPSPWLVASVPNAELVRARWGVELVPIDIADTIAAYRRADPTRARAVAVRFAGTATPTAAVISAARLHPVLTDAIDRAQVDAITVRCFDYLGELATSGCVALAELIDTGVVAGCEGDVASAVAMLLVQALFDRASWIANVAAVDERRDLLLLAHCTVAPRMVDRLELHTHFESGIGIGLRGHFAPGSVTLLRLGGPDLGRVWIAEGEIERAGHAHELCRTQVSVRLDGVRARSLLEAPLGNHLVLFHGRHRTRLERWWRLAFGEEPTGASR